MAADGCGIFRFSPRWPEMDRYITGLPPAQRVEFIEALERRDVELEDWLAHCCGGGLPGPLGINRGDLYDDFTTGAGSPPPNAETGHVWTNGAEFTTVYAQGLFCTTAGEHHMYANSTKANGRIRGRYTTSGARISGGFTFRGAAATDYLSIRFENKDGGGGGLARIVLTNGKYTVLQAASGVVLLNNQIYDIDLTYTGTQITCVINGVEAINYNTSTGKEANTLVGVRQSYTTYGAWGDGNDFAGYIWCSD